ncbi:hypothetical protein PG997_010643 [Apiospora hydei]|uniref:Uncharacterized protein n=1 Tax=Apiospora hydei TaxID=1337664 RepID=A0ABR1VGW2_9PEZI
MSENPRLAPDYSRSVVELYKDVAQVMMEASGTLEVLSHHNRPARGIEGLPTWCPDWTILRGKRILLWPNQYQADGHLHDPAFFRIRDDTLILQGKVLDRVKWLKVFQSDNFDSQERIYRDILDIELVARQMYNQSHGTDSFDDAFRRTLVAARIHMKGPNQDATVLGANAADSLWAAWSSQVEGRPCDMELAKRYNSALYSAMSGRAFVITEGGAIGLVDGTVRIGDVIGVFSGGRVPLALRQKQETSPTAASAPSLYELVGEW